MKVQEFALPDFSGSAASLFADRWVIAITSLAEDSDWATAAAWSVARAAAETGRRTALIDLCLDEPKLHTQATRPLDTGIVDAFLFGASLQHVASQDENPNLHFIGVGTPTAEADEVLELGSGLPDIPLPPVPGYPILGEFPVRQASWRP